MLVMELAEMPPASDRLLKRESAVTFQVLLASSVRLTALAWLSALMAPVSADPFCSVRVIELMLSAVRKMFAFDAGVRGSGSYWRSHRPRA